MKKIISIFIITVFINANFDIYALNMPYSNNIKSFSLKKTEQKLKSDIDIKYPQISNFKNKLIEDKINSSIKNIIDESKNNFIKNIDKDTKAYSDINMNNSLTLDYKTYYIDKNKLSILVYLSTYYVGAAHPNNQILSLNYNLNTGNKIELKDLFKSNSNYLKTISDYSFKQLSKKLATTNDDSWVRSGTSDKTENFKTFTIDSNSITIYFQTYQVASYAEGSQEVKIPFALLKKYLR